jgi:hypothetical protein
VCDSYLPYVLISDGDDEAISVDLDVAIGYMIERLVQIIDAVNYIAEGFDEQKYKKYFDSLALI